MTWAIAENDGRLTVTVGGKDVTPDVVARTLYTNVTPGEHLGVVAFFVKARQVGAGSWAAEVPVEWLRNVAPVGVRIVDERAGATE